MVQRPRIALGLGSLTLDQEVLLANNVAKSMGNNASFTQPPVPLPGLSSLANGLLATSQAYALARSELLRLKSEQRQQRKALRDQLTALAHYADSVGKGDEQVLRSSGMPLRAAPVPPARLAVPTKLTAVMGSKAGEVQLGWLHVKGARSYAIEQTLTPEVAGSWVQQYVAVRSRFVVSGLPAGARVSFRVASVNAAGEGGFTEPVSSLVR